MAKQDKARDPEHAGVEHGVLEVDGVVDGFHIVRGDAAELEVVVDDGVVGPLVEPALAQRHHDPVDEDDGQRARHGFQRTAQKQAPFSARAVLDHQQRQAADRPAEGEHHAQDPGAQHVIDRVVEQRKHGGDDGKDHADDERAHAPLIDHRRSAQVGGKRARMR